MSIFEIPEAELIPYVPEVPSPAGTRLIGTHWDAGYTVDGAPMPRPHERPANLFRVGGVVLSGLPPAELYAYSRQRPWAPLPLQPEDAGAFVLALREGEPRPAPILATVVGALLGYSVLENETQTRVVCGLEPGEPQVASFAPGVVAERWRAPYLDGQELVFHAAGARELVGRPFQHDTVFEVRAELSEGWVEIERVADSWKPRVMGPPPNVFPDPPVATWNPVPDPRDTLVTNVMPEPPQPPAPTGLLARLRRLFGADD